MSTLIWSRAGGRVFLQREAVKGFRYHVLNTTQQLPRPKCGPTTHRCNFHSQTFRRNTLHRPTQKLAVPVLNHVYKPVGAVPRFLRTSQVRSAAPLLGPLLVKLSKPMSRLVFLFIGRRIRSWWAKLPPDQKALYIEKFRQNRRLFIGGGVAVGGAMGIYYQANLEETPITGRRRFMMLNEEQLVKLTAFETKALESMIEKAKLPKNDPNFQRVYRIALKLFVANNLDRTHLIDRINVIVSPEENAFVVTNGQIYVFTGMLGAVANDDELAGILGHELAHNLLGHSAEQLSRSGFFGVFSVALFTLIWAMGSSDFASVFASWLQGKIEDIVINLPFSRKMEREADDVGLMLAAKACYDVTQVPKFWERQVRAEGSEVDENMDYFSTHPSHQKRVVWLHEVMPKALEIRDQMECYKLNGLYNNVGKRFFGGMFRW